jgi:hypothetical protein
MHAWTAFAALLTFHVLALDCVDFATGWTAAILWMALGSIWAYRFLMRLLLEMLLEHHAFQRPGWKGFAFVPLALAGIWLAQVVLLLPGFAFSGR